MSDLLLFSDLPRGSRAIMSQRHEDVSSLDFFPTPPWATRALFEHVMLIPSYVKSAWDPFCGEGHLSEVMREYVDDVFVSDIHDYGYPCEIADFLGLDLPDFDADWIISNPPYGEKIHYFIERALKLQQSRAISTGRTKCVALLMRSTVIAGVTRHREVYEPFPLNKYAPFSERVPMVKGRYDPRAKTATDYAWYVWHLSADGDKWGDNLKIIPPCRKNLEFEDDYVNFNASCAVQKTILEAINGAR